MPIVECTLGPAETTVGNNTYSFDRDDYGRFVARVEDLHHLKCLVGMAAYREVPPIPEDHDDVLPAPTGLGPAQPVEPVSPAPETPATDTASATNGTEGQTDPANQEGGQSGDQDAPDQTNEPNEDPKPDDLTQISGIGPKTAESLVERGFKSFADIVALTDEQIATLNTEMSLKNGIVNNQWVEQAKALEAKKSAPET